MLRRNIWDYAGRHKPYLFVSAALLLAAAPLLNAFLQHGIGMDSLAGDHSLLFAYGAAVLFLILLICSGICGNAFLGTGVLAAAATLLAFADNAKYQVRMEHVFPDDLMWFFRAGQLSGMYDAGGLPETFARMGLFLAPGIVATVFLERRRAWAARGRLLARRRVCLHRVATQCVTAFAGILFLLLLTLPIRSPYLGSIPFIDYEYIAWNQTLNFQRNGYVAAFVSNLKKAGMQEPDGYSEDAVADIVGRWRALADAENMERLDLSQAGIDVVYIMNESFCDPDRFSEHYPFTGEEDTLMPNLHRVKEQAAYGYCYSPRYGGGTANIEFEALTGFSTYFLGWAYPYQSMLPKMDAFPSAAWTFGDFGYASVGLHPYGATMYRRSTVYPVMGYDAFHGLQEFHHFRHDNGSTYVSDLSAYEEVRDYLEGDLEIVDVGLAGEPAEAQVASSDLPDGSAGAGAETGARFVTMITMQNHPQYGSQYDAHAFYSLAEDEDYETRRKISDYMSLIHSSDAALGEFIDWVDERERKTMVVFWGDHLPGVYDGLFDVDEALAYETPFFIYSNFEHEARDLGSVSPNYISTMAMDYLGAQKPPWDYLLDDVRRDIPVLTSPYWDESAPEETQAFEDYRIIQYDVMEGAGYAVDLGLFQV